MPRKFAVSFYLDTGIPPAIFWTYLAHTIAWKCEDEGVPPVGTLECFRPFTEFGDLRYARFETEALS